MVRRQRARIKTEGLLRRDPAGRGVGLRKIPLIGKVGHHVANGRRAELAAAAPGDGARSHRFAGLDVSPDNRGQDFLMPGFEWHVRSHRRYEYTSLNTIVIT